MAVSALVSACAPSTVPAYGNRLPEEGGKPPDCSWFGTLHVLERRAGVHLQSGRGNAEFAMDVKNACGEPEVNGHRSFGEATR